LATPCASSATLSVSKEYVAGAATAPDGTMYAVTLTDATGGTLMTYDVSTAAWSKVSVLPTTHLLGASSLGTAATAKALYVLFTSEDSQDAKGFLAYEFATRTWRMPAAFHFSGFPPARIAASGTKLYGARGTTTEVNLFYQYDETTDASSVPPMPNINMAGLVSGLSVVAIPGDRILGIGGGDCQVYSIADSKWTNVANPANPGVYSYAFDGEHSVYAFSSADRVSGSLMESTQIFDTSSLTWSLGPPMPRALLGASLDFAALGCDGDLYVFDGAQPFPGMPFPKQTMYRLNPGTKTWQQPGGLP
jgi:hypothetical protein